MKKEGNETPEWNHLSIAVASAKQKNPNPGYDLVTRGVLYGGRMLSEQMGAM